LGDKYLLAIQKKIQEEKEKGREREREMGEGRREDRKQRSVRFLKFLTRGLIIRGFTKYHFT